MGDFLATAPASCQFSGMTRYILSAPFTGLLLMASLFAGGKPDAPAEAVAGKATPLRILVVTGGCCHDYRFQSTALAEGIGDQVPADFTVVHEGGDGTRAQLSLYDDPDWAKKYDLVIHNECFADTDDEAYVTRITKAHAAGTPALVVHCAMHTYRALKSDTWRDFLGVTSRHHEHQSKYPVKVVAGDHPIMAGFPKNWITPKDELYIIEKLGPNTKVLATSVSEKTGKEQPVMWTNEYQGTRVAGTTYGHTNETFSDPVFIRFLARSAVWAAGREWKD